MKSENRTRHITEGDVFDDLGLSRSEASALKVKATLLDAILAPPRVFSGNSIALKRSEKDAVRLNPPLAKMRAPRRHRMETMPLPQMDSGHSRRRSRIPSHQRTDAHLGAGRSQSPTA